MAPVLLLLKYFIIYFPLDYIQIPHATLKSSSYDHIENYISWISLSEKQSLRCKVCMCSLMTEIAMLGNEKSRTGMRKTLNHIDLHKCSPSTLWSHLWKNHPLHNRFSLRQKDHSAKTFFVLCEPTLLRRNDFPTNRFETDALSANKLQNTVP